MVEVVVEMGVEVRFVVLGALRRSSGLHRRRSVVKLVDFGVIKRGCELGMQVENCSLSLRNSLN